MFCDCDVWCSSLIRTLKSSSKNRQSFKTFRTKSRSTINREGTLLRLWYPPPDHGCVAGGDDGDAPVSCHGVRTWAGPGPRLSVVTRTRGRSHPHTLASGHSGSLVLWQVSVSTPTCHEARGDSEHVWECGGCEGLSWLCVDVEEFI